MCHKVTQSELDSIASRTGASPQLAATLLLIEEVRQMNARMQQLCETLRRNQASGSSLSLEGDDPLLDPTVLEDLASGLSGFDTSLGVELLDEIYGDKVCPPSSHPPEVIEGVQKSLERTDDPGSEIYKI